MKKNIPRDIPNDLTISVAGWSDSDLLYVNFDIHQCGQIKDGVGFAHPDKCPGWWIISYKDLERIYLAAKKHRENKKGQAKKVL